MHTSRIRPIVNAHSHCALKWAIDGAGLITEIEAKCILLKKRKKVTVHKIIAK
jgi:hypothetical protein